MVSWFYDPISSIVRPSCHWNVFQDCLQILTASQRDIWVRTDAHLFDKSETYWSDTSRRWTDCCEAGIQALGSVISESAVGSHCWHKITCADIVEIKHIMLPPSPRDFKDIYVVFELMETDLHQASHLILPVLNSHLCSRLGVWPPKAVHRLMHAIEAAKFIVEELDTHRASLYLSRNLWNL